MLKLFVNNRSCSPTSKSSQGSCHALLTEDCLSWSTWPSCEQPAVADLHAKVNNVNSADEVRQDIKSVLSKKTVIANQTDEAVSDADNINQTKEVHIGEIQEYKPEGGDQVHAPKKSRKRQSTSLEAGPSKRAKYDMTDHFYVGKLSNVVFFPNQD